MRGCLETKPGGDCQLECSFMAIFLPWSFSQHGGRRVTRPLTWQAGAPRMSIPAIKVMRHCLLWPNLRSHAVSLAFLLGQSSHRPPRPNEETHLLMQECMRVCSHILNRSCILCMGTSFLMGLPSYHTGKPTVAPLCALGHCSASCWQRPLKR